MSGNRLKNKYGNRPAMIVAIVAIILIITIGITSKQRENITVIEKWIGNVITPVQNIINKGVNGIKQNIDFIFSITNLKAENESLKKEVESLRQEILNLNMKKNELEELKALKYALNYIEDDDRHNIISANITGKSPSNWFNIFTVAAGENQGVKKDSIILNSNGLIGKVYEVGGNWAKVVSIIDNSSSVSFQIMRDSNLQGMITGSIANEITGYLFDPLADIIVGDKIITSGLGIYPKGIIIGEITEIDKSSDHLLKTIKVKPAVNFKRITKVIIMIPV
ncbi:MAG TPA: rod shape-determining protein MreC [Oscillospiraceae bacterium]|nr:rod shape-determining protein MreC [Oscillospiraceae bacterium]